MTRHRTDTQAERTVFELAASRASSSGARADGMRLVLFLCQVGMSVDRMKRARGSEGALGEFLVAIRAMRARGC